MVHHNPAAVNRFYQYSQLPENQRRALLEHDNERVNERRARFANRPIHSERGLDLHGIPNPIVRQIAENREWFNYIAAPQPYDPNIVREFYAAMSPAAFDEFEVVMMQQRVVRISIEDICDHYGVARFPELDITFGIPIIPGVGEHEERSEILAASLRLNGHSRWIAKESDIKKVELRPEIALWMKFLKCNLVPSGHDSTVNPYVAKILYCVQHGLPLDIGHIVQLQMVDAALDTNATGILPFPSLITRFCREAGCGIGRTVQPDRAWDKNTYTSIARASRRWENAQMAQQEHMDVQTDEDEAEEEEEEDEDYQPEPVRRPHQRIPVPNDIPGLARYMDTRLENMEERIYSYVDDRFTRMHTDFENWQGSMGGNQQQDEAGPSNAPPQRRVRRNTASSSRRRNREE